jgi:hypothetical protein
MGWNMRGVIETRESAGGETYWSFWATFRSFLRYGTYDEGPSATTDAVLRSQARGLPADVDDRTRKFLEDAVAQGVVDTKQLEGIQLLAHAGHQNRAVLAAMQALGTGEGVEARFLYGFSQ